MSGQHPDIRRRVAANIKRALEESPLSIAEIARRMGGTVNDKTIRRWRDGEAAPNQKYLALFATVVGKEDLTWFYLPHDVEPRADLSLLEGVAD